MQKVKLLCPVKLPDGRIAPSDEIVSVSDDVAFRMIDGDLAEAVGAEEKKTVKEKIK